MTVLAAGEAIVFGSAVHVPARVQMKMPAREPWSATAAPFVDWAKKDVFPLSDVVANWGLGSSEEASTEAAPTESGEMMPVQEPQPDDLDDDIPF